MRPPTPRLLTLAALLLTLALSGCTCDEDSPQTPSVNNIGENNAPNNTTGDNNTNNPNNNTNNPNNNTNNPNNNTNNPNNNTNNSNNNTNTNGMTSAGVPNPLLPTPLVPVVASGEASSSNFKLRFGVRAATTVDTKTP